jgi:hypothetical protein
MAQRILISKDAGNNNQKQLLASFIGQMKFDINVIDDDNAKIAHFILCN